MVTITIYIEGGVLPHSNQNIQTINNAQKLRESFHNLLSQKIDPNQFDLIVETGSGIKQTIKFFQSKQPTENNLYLLIDLDTDIFKRQEKLKALDLEKYSNQVFFMVQEMEAWILSQPNKIEENYSHLKRVKPASKLQNDNNLKGKHPESIKKPSRVLDTIIQRYYRVEKRGKEKKKKYNKLRDGADLLSLLDYVALENTFIDVKCFSTIFTEKN